VLKVKEKILLFKIRTLRDERAFNEIVREHAGALQRFFKMKLPRIEDAEDAFSITLFRTWNYLTAAEVESLSGLLFTIARSVVAEFYRNKKNETVPIEGHDQETEDFEDSFSTKLEVEKVKAKILEIFNDEEQLAFQLRYFDGLRVREVAKKIQRSENATRVLIHRLLKKLRVELTKKV
jgi:RNA polymerase sigma-70 factor (ECF subfamily)